MENIIYAVIVISAMGLIFGLILGISAKIFKVEKYEKIPIIL